jgi:hypothetical protein
VSRDVGRTKRLINPANGGIAFIPRDFFASKTTLSPTPSGRFPVLGALYLNLFEQPVIMIF